MAKIKKKKIAKRKTSKKKVKKKQKQRIRKTKEVLLAENQDLTNKLGEEKEAKEKLKSSIPLKRSLEMIKTSLMALAIGICSLAWLRFGCISETLDPLDLSIVGFFSIALVTVAGIWYANDNYPFYIYNRSLLAVFLSLVIGLAAVFFNESSLPGYLHWIIYLALSFITVVIMVFAGYNKATRMFHYFPSIILCFLFGLITVFCTKPISKYHNANQLERDKQLVEILQIKATEIAIEIILPQEHISEQRYLENVLYIKTETDPNGISWESKSIFCKEGEVEWYKIKLSPEEKEVTYRFDHAWLDYEEKRKIPVP